MNTAAGVPPSPFQANKRLASPVIPGTLSVSHVHLILLLRLNSPSRRLTGTRDANSRRTVMKPTARPLRGQNAATKSVIAVSHCVALFCLFSQARWCGWGPSGPRTTEGCSGRRFPCRGGCHSYGSGCPSRDPSDGVRSGFHHSEPGAVAASPPGRSGPCRYFTNRTALSGPVTV